MYACTFIGHHDCPTEIKPHLYSLIEQLIINENVSVFYVGTHGEFDRIVYDVLCEIEKKHNNITICVVLAYLKKGIESPYYDLQKTIYPESLDFVPPRYAINKRNMYMIKQSRFLICYINDSFSNSYRFFCKAKKENLRIINIGTYDEDKTN